MLTDQTSGRIRELAIQIGDQRRLVRAARDLLDHTVQSLQGDHFQPHPKAAQACRAVSDWLSGTCDPVSARDVALRHVSSHN